MAISPCVECARVIIFIQGVGGIVFNSFLLYSLWLLNLGSPAKLYRLAYSIDGWRRFPCYLLSMDLLCSISLRMLRVSSKSETRSSMRLFYAYIIPIFLQINSLVHGMKYVPTEEFRTKYEAVIKEFHGAERHDCMIYGIPVVSQVSFRLNEFIDNQTQNGEYDLLTQFYFDVFPSYFLSYGIFIFSAVKVLRSFSNIMSDKTERMQKRFFHTQIAQANTLSMKSIEKCFVFLPFVIISIPTGIVAIAAFTGVEMENFSFLFVYAFCISPIAQETLDRSQELQSLSVTFFFILVAVVICICCFKHCKESEQRRRNIENFGPNDYQMTVNNPPQPVESVDFDEGPREPPPVPRMHFYAHEEPRPSFAPPPIPPPDRVSQYRLTEGKQTTGIGGIALNALLVFFLLRINLGSAAKLYRIACIVNAISNIYMSILIAVYINNLSINLVALYNVLLLYIVEIPLMVGGGFVATLYGPLVFHLPGKFVDFLYVAFATDSSSIATSVPITVQIQCVNYVPSNEFRMKYQQIITDLHGSNSDECLIYGIPVVAEFYYDVFPSYTASYTLFFFSAFKIRVKLRSLGNISSSKTAQMQKRFFLTQIAQVLLPLVIISIPTGIMAVAAFIGVDLNNLSFLYVYEFWISPIAQALLLLGFVMKSKRGNSVSGATSVTKRRYDVLWKSLSTFRGIGGIVLNSLLLYILLRTNLGSAAKLYRISCLISAISNIYSHGYRYQCEEFNAILRNIYLKMPLMVGGGFIPTLYGPLLQMIPEPLADFTFVAFVSQVHLMWENLRSSDHVKSKKYPIIMINCYNDEYDLMTMIYFNVFPSYSASYGLFIYSAIQLFFLFNA
uniref:G protein-coupled receptor n=1 Tax=Pristionchus pacificus TaxID=54126 RepID=A0A8R1YL92_PRIPA